MRKQIYINLVIASLILISCGGGGEDPISSPEPPEPEVVLPPEAAMLTFPENNTECNISEILSETQSTVPFDWNDSANTDTYQIIVTNLNTNSIVVSQTVSISAAPITLERGTPYEWSV